MNALEELLLEYLAGQTTINALLEAYWNECDYKQSLVWKVFSGEIHSVKREEFFQGWEASRREWREKYQELLAEQMQNTEPNCGGRSNTCDITAACDAGLYLYAADLFMSATGGDTDISDTLEQWRRTFTNCRDAQAVICEEAKELSLFGHFTCPACEATVWEEDRPGIVCDNCGDQREITDEDEAE